MDYDRDKVLVIAPHPDDETLGCGGTLFRHKYKGDEIYWLIVTNIHEEDGWAVDKVGTRQAEIRKVAEMCGFEKIFKLDFPTTMLDTIPYNDIIGKMSAVIQEVKPSIVYLPNRSDVHTDHQVTFKAAISCCKNFRAPFIRKILMYECLSETESAAPLPENAFQPNVFIDVAEFFEQKCSIMQLYASEVMEAPLPRSMEMIEAVARLRGSRIGVMYAEGYVLLFEKC